jgi:hypothetical protein
MRKIVMALLLAPLLVAGCAPRYVLVLNNGAHVASRGKPKLQNGAYVFKDGKGQPAAIPAGRVREVSPASMVKTWK